jgi:hypothetical protein
MSYCKKWRQRVYFYVIPQKAIMPLYARGCFSLQECKQLAVIAIHDCQSREGQQESYCLHRIATSERQQLHFFYPIATSKQIQIHF